MLRDTKNPCFLHTAITVLHAALLHKSLVKSIKPSWTISFYDWYITLVHYILINICLVLLLISAIIQPVTNLTVIVQWNNVLLYWKTSSTKKAIIKGYLVQYARLEDSVTISSKRAVFVNQNIVQINGLSPNTRYYIQVFTEGIYGKSLPTVVNVTTPPAPIRELYIIHLLIPLLNSSM